MKVFRDEGGRVFQRYAYIRGQVRVSARFRVKEEQLLFGDW